MRINNRFAVLLSSVAVIHVCSLLPTVTAQDEIVIAELGGVSVVSIPQPSPIPELLATKVVLRSAPGSKLVTFENVRISGVVHQVWLPSLSAHVPTAFVDTRPESAWSALALAGWAVADSHLLISPDVVVDELYDVFDLRSETNDWSDPVDANENLPLIQGIVSALTGIGDTKMAAETDSFTLHPEFQTNEIDFAYITTPALSTGAAGEVFLTVGVSGEGIINSGEPGGASFGFNGNDPVVIPFVPEPSAAVLAVFAMAAVTCLRRR